jgi:hypothetical protein
MLVMPDAAADNTRERSFVALLPREQWSRVPCTDRTGREWSRSGTRDCNLHDLDIDNASAKIRYLLPGDGPLSAAPTATHRRALMNTSFWGKVDEFVSWEKSRLSLLGLLRRADTGSGRERFRTACPGSRERFRTVCRGSRERFRTACPGSRERFRTACTGSRERFRTACPGSRERFRRACTGSRERFRTACPGSRERFRRACPGSL